MSNKSELSRLDALYEELRERVDILDAFKIHVMRKDCKKNIHEFETLSPSELCDRVKQIDVPHTLTYYIELTCGKVEMPFFIYSCSDVYRICTWCGKFQELKSGQWANVKEDKK